MSIAGGLHLAVERIQALDGTALQIFTRNQRQWRIPELSQESITEFRKALNAWGDYPVAAHDSYLINLASPKKDVLSRSMHAFSNELVRVEKLGIPYLVTHPGAPGKNINVKPNIYVNSGKMSRKASGKERDVSTGKGHGVSANKGNETAGKSNETDETKTKNQHEDFCSHKESAIRTYVKNLDQALAESKTEHVKILLENTAGQGSVLGSTFHELAAIIELSSFPDRLGVCFDTCHAFAAGYDLRSKDAYLKTFKSFDKTIGLERLCFFHLNDSAYLMGSKRDRHAHIDEGMLGESAFRFILFDPRFQKIGKVIETPKDPDMELDKKNLKLLRSLRMPRSMPY